MPKLIESKQTNRRRFLDRLYEMMEVGVEYPDMSAHKVGETVGLSNSQADGIARSLNETGIIKREIGFRPLVNGLATGRVSTWTLLVAKEVAIAMLDRLDTDETASYKRNISESMKLARAAKSSKEKVNTDIVAIKHVGSIPVQAIVGPDRPNPLEALRDLRKDESYALVEAARQYAHRDQSIESHVDTLVAQAKALGVTIDVDALRSSITIDHDDRLEHVSLVLPYIEQLERSIERLTAQIADYKEKSKTYESIERENKSLKDQNVRLISQRVATPFEVGR